jgi:hypothetical protein
MAAALPLVFGVAGLAASKLLSKPASAPVAQPVPTRNLAAEAAAKSDQVAKRRGIAANLILGAGGAESSAGKTSLGT